MKFVFEAIRSNFQINYSSRWISIKLLNQWNDYLNIPKNTFLISCALFFRNAYISGRSGKTKSAWARVTEPVVLRNYNGFHIQNTREKLHFLIQGSSLFTLIWCPKDEDLCHHSGSNHIPNFVWTFLDFFCMYRCIIQLPRAGSLQYFSPPP